MVKMDWIWPMQWLGKSLLKVETTQFYWQQMGSLITRTFQRINCTSKLQKHAIKKIQLSVVAFWERQGCFELLEKAFQVWKWSLRVSMVAYWK